MVDHGHMEWLLRAAAQTTLTIIQSEGDEDQQSNNMQHGAYLEDADNERTILKTADC